MNDSQIIKTAVAAQVLDANHPQMTDIKARLATVPAADLKRLARKIANAVKRTRAEMAALGL